MTRKITLSKSLQKDVERVKIERKKKYKPPDKLRQKYLRYRRDDLNKGFGELDYTEKEFRSMIIGRVCVYCNINKNLGLDRIDNSRGHQRDNVQPCCVKCNKVRNNEFTVEEMKALVRFIKKFRGYWNETTNI